METQIDIDLILEITGVIFNLLYLFFIIKEKKICWIFGIIGSLLSIALFYKTKLYSESILYIYYVIIGAYGYYLWDKKDKHNEEIKITTWSFLSHIYVFVIGTVLAITLGYCFENYTDAKNAYLDAFTTIFSFLASYLEAKKVLSSWIFWIILNGLSVYLYNLRALDLYSVLAIIYFISSFFGLYSWNKRYKLKIA